MKKYILFDLDGTLTDPMEGICKSAARGLAHFGIKADYHDLTFFIGPPLLDTYRDRYGMNDEQAREAVAAFREYFQPTGIYENEIYPCFFYREISSNFLSLFQNLYLLFLSY